MALDLVMDIRHSDGVLVFRERRPSNRYFCVWERIGEVDEEVIAAEIDEADAVSTEEFADEL